VKIRRRKLSRWSPLFRSPSLADSLLLYAGDSMRQGSAIWHSHHGNEKPHLHLQHHAGHDETRPGRRHSIQHHHDHPDDHERQQPRQEGHWHFVVPAESLGLSSQLLILAICTLWIAISIPQTPSAARRPSYPARGPPPSA